ncbi:MAG: stage II sporulation protein M [Holophagaceae bacterium]|nr:stage II sporulation protein M [Holophagaceae bacterium]
MKQEAFIAQHQLQWETLERWLDAGGKKGDGPAAAPIPPDDIPRLYRQVCNHLALARERQYSALLMDRLNGLVLRAHQRLHGARAGLSMDGLNYIRSGFPRAIRAEWRLVALSALLMLGPYGAMMAAVRLKPDAAFLMMAPSQLAQFEAMYSPGNRALGPAREADTDVAMFGFYIRNNIGLDFQCFATGLLLGLGSIFFLVYNGLMFGTVEGHLVNAGLAHTFYGFVVGHSALELTAAIFAGAAGLKIGFAWLAPGRRPRLESLKEAARKAVRIMYGTAAMTLMAAFVEAFWSSQVDVPFGLKLAFGGAMAALLLAYFLLAGRGPGDVHAG